MAGFYQGQQMVKKKAKQSMFSFMETPEFQKSPRSKSGSRVMRARVKSNMRTNQKSSWIDSMLGTGSSHTLRSTRQVLDNNRRLTRPPVPAPRIKPRQIAPTAPLPRRAPRASEHRPRSRGWIRMGLGIGAALWLLTVVQPVERLRGYIQKIDFSASGQSAANKPQAVARTTPPVIEETKNIQAAVYAGLKSGAVALWRNSNGLWYQVDGEGNLKQSGPPQSEENLGLPILTGVKTRQVEEGSQTVVKLQSGDDMLARLLPLNPDLAPEIELIRMDDPTNPVLVTFDGVLAPLGEMNYQKKQARLALVLADLSSKKKRAVQVDMRFSNSAVVKLKK